MKLQKDLCLKTVQELKKDYPDTDRPHLIQAAMHIHEKQFGKAADCLKDRISTSDCSVTLKLTLAQLYLGQGHVYQACDVLRDLDELSYKPGVVRITKLFQVVFNKVFKSDFQKLAKYSGTFRPASVKFSQS